MIDSDNALIASGVDFVTITGVDTRFSKIR